MIEQVFLIII